MELVSRISAPWWPSSFTLPHREIPRFGVSRLVILVVISFVWGGCNGQLPEDYLPQVQMLEIISSPTNRSSAVNLWKDRNTDVIIGEDTNPTSRILMKCNATYPVQWVYLGDGNPEFTTFTNVKWHDDPDVPMSFEAEASLGLLGFQGVLREEDTGNYTCRSIQEPSVHSYYYIYVPGDSLFASANGTNITYTPKDMFVRVPCGVSHPRTSVTLCKKDKNDKLTCPVSGASSFNTKGGFLINLKKQRNPSGTYVCSANFDRAVRTIEFNIMREGETPKPVPPVEAPPTYMPKPGKNLCEPSPCGKQAECSVVDGRAVCYCFRGLNGDPYDECAPGKCRSSRECPRGKFCRQGQCTSNPCNPSPCGKGGECTILRGQSKCSCQNGYSGLPPNCVKSCADSFDCKEDETCIKSICQSPCPGPCGQNAECRVLTSGVKRTAQCSCPTGFLGDPLKSCYKFNSTTPGPWNNCPPGYVGHPPACKLKECSSDLDCPFGRKCKSQLCEKGFEPSCTGKCGINAECNISPTTNDPICTCPSGTTGNPMIRCMNSAGVPQAPSPTTWGDPCLPNPCQSPAECHFIQGSRTCVCPPGFTGDPTNCMQIQPTIPSSHFPPSGFPSSRFPTSGSPPSRFPPSDSPPSRFPPSDSPPSRFPPSDSFPSRFPPSDSPPSRFPPSDSFPSRFPPSDSSTSRFPPSDSFPSRLPPSGSPPSRFPPSGSSSGFPPTSSTVESNVMCRYDGDCKPGENCVGGRCQDPCNGLCGFNAICEPAYHRKYRSISTTTNGKLLRSQPENTCSCPPGHEGNPYVSCILIRTNPPPPQHPPLPSVTTSADPVCFPNPCGKYAECNIVNNGPLCSCPPGYDGNPYKECHYPILSPPTNEYTPPAPKPTSARTTPLSPSELDYQGHSWGHHTPIITREPPPPMSDRDGSYYNSRPAPPPPYSENRSPYPPPPPPPPQESYPSHHNNRDYGSKVDVVIGHPPPYLPDPTTLQVGDTPTPKTLGRPMSPIDIDTPPPYPPSSPTQDNVRDECTFKNPYADYDMDSCGVGRRCERDFRGIKRCVCISPFDCTGPTSTYLGGKCLTSRDCLLSDHICINNTCKNPCSPAHSPCADVAHSECRVIEGNVLCTCKRGYIGNPSSGLDCRPKHAMIGSDPVVPSNVAVLDQNNRKFIIIHGIFRNNSIGHTVFHNNTNSNPNLTDINSVSVVSGSFDSSSSYADEDYDDYDIDVNTGTRGNTKYHRRHNDDKQVGVKTQGKDLLLGQCGFGSGRNCDEKSHCKVIDGTPMCVCKTGYKGEFPYCKPQCEKHEDCPETMSCQYHQCMDPCIEEKHYCAQNAFCRVTNHTASCTCDPGFVGVPWIQCTKVEVATKDDCMGFNCEKRKS